MKRMFWAGAILAVALPVVAGETPVVIAHRGASGYLPEHTLAAKALAYGMGADFLEQDIVLSKDGIPVVLHDVQIDSVTDVAHRFPGRQRDDGRFYAIDFTVAELKQLKASERFDPDTGKAVHLGRFPVGQATFEIPTLEEELQLIQGLNKRTGKNVGIYPEIKAPAWHRKQGQDISKIVLKVLDRYGYKTKSDNAWLQCFDLDELKRIRSELGYRGKLVLLTGGSNTRLTRPYLAEMAQVVDGIGPDLHQVVVPGTDRDYELTDLVKNAHDFKLAVHPYTLNVDSLPRYAASYENLCRIVLVEAGADGAFTDFPDRMVAFVRSQRKVKD